MALSVVGIRRHVKLARLAALDLTHVGIGQSRWITRLFHAMAHLLSAANGAACNRLGTSIHVSDEYNPQTLYKCPPRSPAVPACHWKRPVMLSLTTFAASVGSTSMDAKMSVHRSRGGGKYRLVLALKFSYGLSVATVR